LCGAACAFGREQVRGTPRQAAEENGRARIPIGLHFRKAVEEAARSATAQRACS
jgi:hypothetical protein